jgi:O-acetyl-ADP-ribose deacetylase (regulator of RNase III)
MATIGVTLGDITTMEVDAIVNAANAELVPGGGVDGAIHAAGGPSIALETGRIVAERGPLGTGEAVATGAGALPARYVIHTVGPIWSRHTEASAVGLLAACYANSLDIAEDLACSRVAFPNISTGVYGFPKKLAGRTAVSAVAAWLSTGPQAVTDITFVCFDGENFGIYEDLLRV